MTTLHFVKKARKANKAYGIKKGDSYYWWQFAFGRKQCSKTQPKRSQYMTQSSTLGAIYDLEDQLEKMKLDDINPDCLEDIKMEVENLRDECESNRDNMPEQLQDSSVLSEYIDNLDSWLSELEGIDLSDCDEDECNREAIDEWSQMDKEDRKGNKKADWIAERTEELLDERCQEALDEIQNCQYPG